MRITEKERAGVQENYPKLQIRSSRETEVVMGMDGQGYLHVGLQYPEHIERPADFNKLRSQRFKGVSLHTLGFFDGLRGLDAIVGVLVRDKIVKRSNIHENTPKEFDHVFENVDRQLALAAA